MCITDGAWSIFGSGRLRVPRVLVRPATNGYLLTSLFISKYSYNIWHTSTPAYLAHAKVLRATASSFTPPSPVQSKCGTSDHPLGIFRHIRSPAWYLPFILSKMPFSRFSENFIHVYRALCPLSTRNKTTIKSRGSLLARDMGYYCHMKKKFVPEVCHVQNCLVFGR